jgi:hypothetical protein
MGKTTVRIVREDRINPTTVPIMGIIRKGIMEDKTAGVITIVLPAVMTGKGKAEVMTVKAVMDRVAEATTGRVADTTTAQVETTIVKAAVTTVQAVEITTIAPVPITIANKEDTMLILNNDSMITPKENRRKKGTDWLKNAVRE